MGVFDFDNNGCKDLFFANAHFPQPGHHVGAPSPLPNRIFRNKGAGRFEDAFPQRTIAAPPLQISITMAESMS
jgi:hypothetical protein